jgi:hypothetical protein
MVVKVTRAMPALPLLETWPVKPVDFGWTRRIFKVFLLMLRDGKGLFQKAC